MSVSAGTNEVVDENVENVTKDAVEFRFVIASLFGGSRTGSSNSVSLMVS